MMEYRSNNSRQSATPAANQDQQDERSHLPKLPLNSSPHQLEKHAAANQSNLGLARKDSFESALLRNNNGAPMQQSRGQHISMYSQLGNQKVNSRRVLQEKGPDTINTQGIYYSAGASDIIKQTPNSQTENTQKTFQANGVLPRINRESTTNASEYIGAGGISQIGYGSQEEHSISTIPQHMIGTNLNRQQQQLIGQQQLRQGLAQVKSEEQLALAAMNARYEHSKGVMSPSPDLKATPQMHSNKKQHGGVNYYSGQKSHMSRHQIEQMSGQTMTAEGSFIDAPPIPYQRRYKADIHNHSASTVVPQQSETKFRRNLNHPQRPDDANNQHNSEYYAMGEARQANSTQPLDESTTSQHVGKKQESRAVMMSAKKLSSSAQHNMRQDGELRSEVGSQSIKNSKQRQSHIRYATPPAEKHESSSNKEGYGQQPSYLHQTLEMQSALDNIKSGGRRRKNKNFSDSSMLHLNHARQIRMSPMAKQAHEQNFNIKSQKCLLSQEADPQETISMFRENMRRAGAAQNPVNNRSHNFTNQGLGDKKMPNRSSQNASEAGAAANRKNNYLFDVRQRNKMPGEGSPLNYYQESIPDNYSADSMSDVCMQIATQALSKCYNIVPQLAQQLIADTREQINHYRSQISFQGESSQNKRVILSPHESSVFFNTISDRFYQKSDLIIEKNYDLRPILSMILLGLQGYQSEKTKIDALKCVKFLSDINQGHFRAKIWKWIKYTTIKQQKPQEDGSMVQYPGKRPKINVHVQGFIQSVHDIMELQGNAELNMLACRTLVGIAQNSLFELFLSQLPSLFTDRFQYLQMFNEHYQMYQKAMKEQVDEIERSSLLKKFVQLGIPNFLVAQCLCLIEGNLIHQKETQLEGFIPQSRPESGILSQRSKRVFQRIQDENSTVVSLLTEIWVNIPSLFSSPQSTQMLQHEYEDDDFGLKERLNSGSNGDQRKKLLGTKVLSLFKKVSSNASLAFKLTLVTRLFSVLETLSMEMDSFAETTFRLLVFFLVEWHDNKVLRNHLMINFTEILQMDKVLSLRQLIEPICSIIVLNLNKDDVKQRKYMTMADFTFMWDIANKQRLTVESALAICQVMQIYMVKRDPQYRGVAEKIFLKLIGKFSSEDIMHNFLKKHCEEAIGELAIVDNLIRMGTTTSKPDMLMKSNALLSQSEKHSSNSDNFETQLNLHYLFKHLLLLARGKAHQPENPETTTDSAILENQFRFIRLHIINTIQSSLNATPPERQSPTLISLLKKLQANETSMPDHLHINKAMALNNSASLDESLTKELNQAVPTEKQMNLEQARRLLGNRANMQSIQSHETLLTPMQREALLDTIKKDGPVIHVDQASSSLQPSHLNFNLAPVGEAVQDEDGQSSFPNGLSVIESKKVPPATTNSSDYEPTRHNKTIVAASVMFQEVREAEKQRNAKTSLDLQEEAPIEEEDVNIQESPTRGQRKEIGTEYDPPMGSGAKIGTSSISDVIQPIHFSSAGIQTNPVQVNKKMQVSIHGTSTLEATSSVDPHTFEKKNAELQTSVIVGREQSPNNTSVHSKPPAISEKDKHNKSNSDMQLIKKKDDQKSPITPITEVEAEQVVSPPLGSQRRQVQQTQQRIEEELNLSKEDSKMESEDKNLRTASKMEVDDKHKLEQPSALSHRTMGAPDKQVNKASSASGQPQKQKTAKLDVRQALEKIKTNLDSVTKNLKDSQVAGYSNNGTTFRTEIYTTDGEGPVPREDDDYQLRQPQPSIQVNQTDASDEGKYEVPEHIQEPSSKPSLTKYGSKRRILVSLQQDEERSIQNNSQKGMRPGRKNCVYCFKSGIETTAHTSANCPLPHRKIAKLADSDLKTRQKMANLDLNSRSAVVLPMHEIQTPTYFEKSGRFSTLDPQQPKGILSLNRLPDISPINMNPNSTVAFEPSGQMSSRRRNISMDRIPLKSGSVSVLTKGATPRNQLYAGLPISLPKMSDFWRGNPLTQTQYGDSINYQTQQVTPTAAINVAQSTQAPLTRYQTQMSVQEEEEMSEAFLAHNRKLQEKQKLMVQLAQSALPRRSMTQAHIADDSGNVASPDHTHKRTDYNWISGDATNIAPRDKPLETPQQRKQEVKRLEKALERLLINLGQDQDPQMYETQIPEEEELERESEKPQKRNAEDNKLSNTMRSQQPSVEEVQKHMESYVNTLQDGYLGIGSGVASPIEMEIQDESINIVKPQVFDPMHKGLANLSPTQLERLKNLAAMKDDDEDLSPSEEKDLATLLNLLENGIKVDGRHPGMINLTPSQQSQFLDLYEADCLNKPPLSPDKKRQLNKLKDLIVHGTPLDSKHPGVINLSPDQKKDLLSIEKKQDRVQPLTPQEEESLGNYKELIAHGQPVDSNHPGVVNLTENMKDRLKEFEGRPESLTPSEKAEDEKIKNLIVHGTPLDQNHQGAANLSPDELAKFKQLLKPGQYHPSQKKELNSLQEKVLDGNPIDATHPGMANITPVLQETFKLLLDKKKNDPNGLSPPQQEKLKDLMNRIAHGIPLNKEHPGMSHLTPGQQTEVKGLMRRKDNGNVMSPDDARVLQNLQNLMLFGKPLDENHPGYKALKPADQKRFSRLNANHKEGKPLSPENADDLEKLARKIQTNSGPLGSKHEGFNNLMPQEQEDFQKIGKKQADRAPLDPKERAEIERLKGLMRPAFPYDKNHPGFDSLTAPEQKKLLNCNKKDEAGVPLNQDEDDSVKQIKANMDSPVEFGENHPGWNNLVPKEKTRFLKNVAKEQDIGPLNPAEDQDQEMMKDVMKNGRPIDEHHPGFDNLNPEQQDAFKNIFKLREEGKNLTPDEGQDMDNLEDIIVNGIPIDENHPGFKGLDPYQKKRFKNLKEPYDEREMSPMQQKEMDNLRTAISPSFFSPDLAAALRSLAKKPELDDEEQDQKDRLEELKRCLPHTQKEDELNDDEKDRLMKYLTARLFEELITPQQLDDMNDLLMRSKDFDRGLTPDEQERMKILAKMKFKGAELDPEEEKEMEMLHKKQNKGIGGLTPRQIDILQQLQGLQDQGMHMTPDMKLSLKEMCDKRDFPSQLLPNQEEELAEMEASNANGSITPVCKDRLKAFWRMKYHPQLMDLENRALFYMMKDNESLPKLDKDQEEQLFALQKRFNCLPWINPKQILYMEKLQNEITEGKPLTVPKKKDLYRLQQLPKKELAASDIPPLDDVECHDFKQLKGKRDRGDQMSPDELGRYRDLKDKIKKHKEDEQKTNQSMRTPIRSNHSPDIAEMQKSNIKTPDDQLKKQMTNRKVTYAPLPNLNSSDGNSMILPTMQNQITSPPQMSHAMSQAQAMSSASPDIGEDISPRSSIGKSERRAAQAAFKKAIRRGNCTLKELIDQFFIIEERYMIRDFDRGIRTNFQFAQAINQSQIDEDRQKPLSLKEFLKYAVDKKIKFRQHHVIEILRGESEHNNIKFVSFVKLLILASCGGDRTKIGISNFKKLMHHMDIFK